MPTHKDAPLRQHLAMAAGAGKILKKFYAPCPPNSADLGRGLLSLENSIRNPATIKKLAFVDGHRIAIGLVLQI
jgi:hypothetical protein